MKTQTNWLPILIALALALLCHQLFAQMPPTMPAIQPKTVTKASLTPKQASLVTATMVRTPTPWIPVKVVVISWHPGLDGANVASIIETTTNDLADPNKSWEIVYAGKSTNFLYTNDWGHYRWFRGSTTLTNL